MAVELALDAGIDRRPLLGLALAHLFTHSGGVGIVAAQARAAVNGALELPGSVGWPGRQRLSQVQGCGIRGQQRQRLGAHPLHQALAGRLGGRGGAELLGLRLGQAGAQQLAIDGR